MAYYYTDGIFLFNFQDWSNPAIQSKTSRMQNLLNILASPTADLFLPPWCSLTRLPARAVLMSIRTTRVQTGSAFVKTIIDALEWPVQRGTIPFYPGFDEGGGLFVHLFYSQS